MSRYYYELANAARTLQNGEEMNAAGMAGIDTSLTEVLAQMIGDRDVSTDTQNRVEAVRSALQSVAKNIAQMMAPQVRELRQLAAKFPDDVG